jgi:ABC-type polar amino acid transport system ATPase subunit/GNAT superfamily N-acetyltransferase
VKVNLMLSTPVSKGFRAARIQGIYDVPIREVQNVTITADIPIEDRDWNVGAIVGASGSGKTTIAKTLWPKAHHTFGDHKWTSQCLLDDFPEHMSPTEITSVLTAVGFSSPTAWLRGYHVLSTGQQMRADLARSLCEPRSEDEPTVFDEFTSVVDRTVAAAVSAATAKHVRRTKSQFVAVTCHRDVLPWLEPDWFYDVDEGRFHWGSLCRPPIQLEIREGSRSAWALFHQHHYLTSDLARSCRPFLTYATIDGVERLVGFLALMPVAGHKGWWRGHRTVVLPDFQGLGIGTRMREAIAEQLWVKERKRFRSTTASPSLIAHCRRHPEMWRLAMAPKMKPPSGPKSTTGNAKRPTLTSAGRLTTTWVYLPEALRK